MYKESTLKRFYLRHLQSYNHIKLRSIDKSPRLNVNNVTLKAQLFVCLILPPKFNEMYDNLKHLKRLRITFLFIYYNTSARRKVFELTTTNW